MGSRLADIAAHDAWALWLAAPALGIVLVCVGVWWWSRPARPATTASSIEGHHAYLDALSRSPRERVEAPTGDLPTATVDPLTHAVVLDATVLDAATSAPGVDVDGDDEPTTPTAVTVHA